MKYISAFKEATTTASTSKLFSPFRIYQGFPLNHLKRDVILLYPKD